ncbi:unnamed protein product, partial [Prorocentrum cordatum]
RRRRLAPPVFVTAPASEPKAARRTPARPKRRAPSAGRPSAAAGASEPSGGAAEALTARMAHGALSRGAPDGAAGPGPGCTGRAGGAGGSGGEGRRRGARAGRRNAIATLRTVAAAAAPPRLGGGADTQGALPLGDPRGGGRHHPPRPGPHVGQWALGGTESAHPCGVQCRAPSKTGERAWQTRRAREGSREGEEKEEQEQQKHEDEKEALKRGTKKLAPTRRRATLPRAREEPAGEARRRRASRRRHISGAPRRAEAARRRTGGSGERHQHTSADVRVESERPP